MISRQETDHLITFMENNLSDGDRSALTLSLPALLEWEKPWKMNSQTQTAANKK